MAQGGKRGEGKRGERKEGSFSFTPCPLPPPSFMHEDLSFCHFYLSDKCNFVCHVASLVVFIFGLLLCLEFAVGTHIVLLLSFLYSLSLFPVSFKSAVTGSVILLLESTVAHYVVSDFSFVSKCALVCFLIAFLLQRTGMRVFQIKTPLFNAKQILYWVPLYLFLRLSGSSLLEKVATSSRKYASYDVMKEKVSKEEWKKIYESRQQPRKGIDVESYPIYGFGRSTWKNWAGNISCTPEKTFFPENLDDLLAIVQMARKNSKKIRVVGTAHSWTSLSTTEGYQVDTRLMRRVVQVDPVNMTATVETGTTVADLDNELRKYNLCIKANVVLTCVTYGGLVATGSHGSGRNYSAISDLVHKISIIDGNGVLQEFSEETHGKDVMDAVRLNLGAFGIIYQITLKVFPMLYYRKHIRVVPMDEVMHNPQKLRETVLAHDAIEAFWWPFTNRLWLMTFDQLDGPEKVQKQPAWQWAMWQVFQFVKIYGGGAFLIPIAHRIPRLSRLVCHLMSHFAFAPSDVRLPAPDAIHFQPFVEGWPINCSAFAFKASQDFSNIVKEWKNVEDIINGYAAKGIYPLNNVVEFRFTAHGTGLISPCNGKVGDMFCLLEIVSSTPAFYEFPPIARDICMQWMRNSDMPRPHWSKWWDLLPDEVIYPYLQKAFGENLRKFCKVRAEYDPQGIFRNELLEKLSTFA